MAKTHIEQAWTLSQQIQGFDDIRFDAAYTLSQLYEQQNQSHAAKTILRKAIENSQHNIFWYSKLLFQIAVSNSFNSKFKYDSSTLQIQFFRESMPMIRNIAYALNSFQLVLIWLKKIMLPI